MTVLSEDEAKLRRCCKPSGKTISENGACIGSMCMAWRWRHRAVYVPDESDHPAHWEYHIEGRGYCGFANSPTEATHRDGLPLEGGAR